MTAAVIGSRTTGSFDEATDLTFTYPSGIVSGSLLVLHVGNDGVDEPSLPTDWSAGDNVGGGVVQATTFYRIATGSLSGTFSSTLAAVQTGNWECLRWSGNHATQAPDFANDGITKSTTPDPPELTVSWATGEDNAWAAFFSQDDARSTNPVGISGWTDGFLNVQGSGASGNVFGLSDLASSVDVLNPGTFTTDRSDSWGTFTIAVRPGVAAADVGLVLPRRRIYLPKPVTGW